MIKKRTTILFLLLLIVYFLAFGFHYLRTLDVRAAEGAVLTIVPSTGQLDKNVVIEVEIKLNTSGEQTDGVDLILGYPQTVLEVVDADASQEGVQISPGGLYPNTLVNKVLTAQGRIGFSQVTSPGQHFSGEGVLATVSFKVIGAGSAELKFDFTPGSTRDCNVVAEGRDVLIEANGARFVLAGDETPIIEPEPSETPGDFVETPEPLPTEAPASEETATSTLLEVLQSKTGLLVLGLIVLSAAIALVVLKKRRG